MENYRDFLDSIEKLIFLEDKPEAADVIIVPGNRFAKNAENAAALYKSGYAPIIITSGRFAKGAGHFRGSLDEKYDGNFRTESEFLSYVLQKNGVPASSIIEEPNATYTYENALFSREKLDLAGINPKKGIICCRNTHARRCYMYFKTVFPDTKWLIYPSELEGITKENWRDTENGISQVMGEVTRLITQFELWM